ncbi:MAG: hypothetical protein ABR975_00755 [Vulcanimicrobiaceae bacterium]
MLDTQADAAGGVHPGSDAVADWSPYAHRAGHPFDELYAKLRPEIDAIVAQYEQKRSALLPMAHLFQEHEGFLSSNALAVIHGLLPREDRRLAPGDDRRRCLLL